MKLKKRIIKIFAIGYCCKALFLSAVPAQAYVWPVISFEAVAEFLNSVVTGMAEVETSMAEVESYSKTIHAIGDQVSAVAKFIAELSATLEHISKNVKKIVRALQYTDKTMQKLMTDTSKMIDKAGDEKSTITEQTVDTVNKQAENDGKVDSDVVKDNEEQIKDLDESVNKALDESKKSMDELGKIGDDSLKSLENVVENNNDINNEEKNRLLDEIQTAKEDMNTVQQKADALSNQMNDDYNKNSQDVTNAYDDYKKAVDDYNAGKITKDELAAKGQELQNNVNNTKENADYSEQITDITNQLENMLDNAGKISEDISDGIANSKDYPDDAFLNITNSNLKFAFNFNKKTEHASLVGCYATKGDCDNIYSLEGDNSFLIPKEFTAKGSVKTSNPPCQDFTFDDLEEKKQDKFTEKFRDCVTRANTEKAYFWPDIGTEDDLAQMDIFDKVTEPRFCNHSYCYEKKGVYRHIAEDYASANILNANQTKQYARTWLGLEADDKGSELNKFIQQFKNIDNTRNAYNYLGMIEIEYLKMLSRLRRVDAINRAKKVIDYYRPLTHLFIDGRDEDFLKATNGSPRATGSMEIKAPETCEQWGSDCNRVITVVSNVFPYLCGLTDSEEGAKAFSVQYMDKNSEKIHEAEEAIKGCMKAYIEPATNGSQDGEVVGNPDDLKKEWREKEIKATTDSLFYTILLSTINLYNSSKDYAHLKSSDEVNIASLNQDLKDAKTVRDDYAACAKINHYGTNQLLTIIDADAQALQSEIISDMLNITFDYFDDENPNAKKSNGAK